ncbi:halocyanin [Salinigranum rubrum]|uniref:Halocyanin n=2 Tax=Salinigranum rubrum TaxID=755307 RepID=A0A2I8VGT3_9EURY|nr:halocyanin domain-containing protein [Salinigranum rubrum]AUV81135.1 halocyanin [Salinigranum rubrum]
MSDTQMSRRAFLTAAGGTAAVAAGSGNAAAQTTEPDWGGHLDGVDGGYQDMRGQSEVTVEVGAEGNGGALAFAPAGIWVDPGTTVTWEWTGEGGGHNVVSSEGPASLDSGAPVSEAGTTYEHTFGEDQVGITKYHCAPHEALGMLGAVAVGSDIPTVEVGGGGGGSSAPQVPESAKTLGVATTFAMVATLGLAFFFMKYGGDYETPEE